MYIFGIWHKVIGKYTRRSIRNSYTYMKTLNIKTNIPVSYVKFCSVVFLGRIAHAQKYMYIHTHSYQWIPRIITNQNFGNSRVFKELARVSRAFVYVRVKLPVQCVVVDSKYQKLEISKRLQRINLEGSSRTRETPRLLAAHIERVSFCKSCYFDWQQPVKWREIKFDWIASSRFV